MVNSQVTQMSLRQNSRSIGLGGGLKQKAQQIKSNIIKTRKQEEVKRNIAQQKTKVDEQIKSLKQRLQDVQGILKGGQALAGKKDFEKANIQQSSINQQLRQLNQLNEALNKGGYYQNIDSILSNISKSFKTYETSRIKEYTSSYARRQSKSKVPSGKLVKTTFSDGKVIREYEVPVETKQETLPSTTQEAVTSQSKVSTFDPTQYGIKTAEEFVSNLGKTQVIPTTSQATNIITTSGGYSRVNPITKKGEYVLQSGSIVPVTPETTKAIMSGATERQIQAQGLVSKPTYVNPTISSETRRYQDLGYTQNQAKRLAKESIKQGGMSFAPDYASKITRRKIGATGFVSALSSSDKDLKDMKPSDSYDTGISTGLLDRFSNRVVRVTPIGNRVTNVVSDIIQGTKQGKEKGLSTGTGLTISAYNQEEYTNAELYEEPRKNILERLRGFSQRQYQLRSTEEILGLGNVGSIGGEEVLNTLEPVWTKIEEGRTRSTWNLSPEEFINVKEQKTYGKGNKLPFGLQEATEFVKDPLSIEGEQIIKGEKFNPFLLTFYPSGRLSQTETGKRISESLFGNIQQDKLQRYSEIGASITGGLNLGIFFDPAFATGGTTRKAKTKSAELKFEGRFDKLAKELGEEVAKDETGLYLKKEGKIYKTKQMSDYVDEVRKYINEAKKLNLNQEQSIKFLKKLRSTYGDDVIREYAAQEALNPISSLAIESKPPINEVLIDIQGYIGNIKGAGTITGLSTFEIQPSQVRETTFLGTNKDLSPDIRGTNWIDLSLKIPTGIKIKTKTEQKIEQKLKIDLLGFTDLKTKSDFKTNLKNKADLRNDVITNLYQPTRIRNQQPRTPITTRMKQPKQRVPKVNIGFPKQSKVKRIKKGKKKKTKEEFLAITKRYGKEKIIGIGRTAFEAEQIAKRDVLGTLGATVKVKEKSTGRQIQVSESKLFRRSKRDPLAVVQRKTARLMSLGERREIKQARSRREVLSLK